MINEEGRIFIPAYRLTSVLVTFELDIPLTMELNVVFEEVFNLHTANRFLIRQQLIPTSELRAIADFRAFLAAL